jgi:hypothetical protein
LIILLLPLFSEVNRFIDFLDNAKNPFLFHSDDLLQILGLVEASKTKMSVLHLLVPRLIDPKSSFDQVTALFRFAEEKTQVEELYKERIQIVNAAVFKRSEKGNNVLAAGRGRGRASRQTTVGRPMSLPTHLTEEEVVTIYQPFKTTDTLEKSEAVPITTEAEGK